MTLSFIKDERAQSIQIGFILILGLLILMLGIYQSSIIPDQNRSAEITHSNDIEFEFENIETSIFNTAMSGTPLTNTYPMSLRYQPRIITVNPPPPAGTLSTSSVDNIVISNESMEHEVPTRYLEYDVDYRLYDEPPTYTREIGFIYRNFGERQTAISSNQFILNDGFAIIALQGEYSETSFESIRLRFERTDDLVKYRITDPEITIPTRLNEGYWTEYSESNNNIDMVSYDDETVTLSRDGTVDLYLTSVSMSGTTDGGVNHNAIDLPVEDTDESSLPGDEPGDEPGGEFEFVSYNAERTDDGATYNFEVSAGAHDITEVNVEISRSTNRNVRDSDTYTNEDPSGFSASGTLTVTGNFNFDAQVVFIAEDSSGEIIEESILLEQ